MGKPRVVETDQGIQGDFTVVIYDQMQRRFRDRGWIETGEILSSRPDKIQTIWFRAGIIIGAGIYQMSPLIAAGAGGAAGTIAVWIAATKRALSDASQIRGIIDQELTEDLEQDIRRISNARLWQFRTAASKSLVEYARERLSRQLAASGAPPEGVDGAKHLFDPNALTLGFARRFATYKRPNLLLHDPERLLRLLTNTQRPVQLILAGKAHPADQAGQAQIGRAHV
jgi:hypothetical protein